MKKKVLSHVCAVYIDEVRPGTVFDIVTTTSDVIKEGQKYTGYFVHVIALDELARSGRVRIPLTTDRNSTEKEGLEGLLRGLQGKLSDMIGELYCAI